MFKNLACAALAATLGFAGLSAQGELIYQPQSGQALDAQWRTAGSQLFESVARINEALAALELKNRDTGTTKLDEALKVLNSSSVNYEKIVGSLGKPRPVPAASAKVQAVFKSFTLTIPKDEKEAALLANQETVRLMQFIVANRSKILSSDVVAIGEVLIAIDRLQRVGTHTAELMTGLK